MTRWPVLRRRPFVLVVGGEVLSMVGDSVYLIALAILILRESSAAVLAVSLVFLVVPRAVLMLVGGVLTDRFSARVVMFCSHLSRAVLVTALTLSVATGHTATWQFFLISAAFGVADAFFWPASKTILPTLVPPSELVQANAVNSVGEQAAGLRTAPGRRAAALDERHRRRIREGLAYARAKPGVRVVLIIISASALSYSGLFGVALPGLASTLPNSPLALGLMLSGWGVGQLLGAASAGVTGLPSRWGLLITAMAYAEAITFLAMGFLPSIWVIAPLLTLLGFGVAYASDVALPAWIQTTTPDAMLGRVNSVIDVPRMIFEPISIIVMGLLVGIDVRLALAAAALPMLLAALILSFTRAARRMGGAATAGSVQPAQVLHHDTVLPPLGCPADGRTAP